MACKVRIVIGACALAGLRCDQIWSMHDQAKYEALEPSEIFADGTSARPLVNGTVPRIAPDGWWEEPDAPAAERPPVTEDVLARGRRLFDINCTMCHGYAGYGDGIVVQRGYPAPPTYHTDRLRNLPDDHFYHVITDGLGKMPAYRNKVRPPDRWAVIAYVRALQMSQRAPAEMLSVDMREELERASVGGPPDSAEAPGRRGSRETQP